MNKYRNIKTEVDGTKFSSRLEARRYSELKLLERAGAITDLKLQVRYDLMAGDKPILITSGRYTKGRKAQYVADFVYRDIESGATIIEDTKGKRTAEYKLKKAIMERMGYLIVEITRGGRR